MGICSFSAPQPIGVSFRFRKCKFSNNSRNAIQHSAVDMGSGLTTPARDFHRAGPPLLQASQWHPRVAKRSSDRSSARRPLPQAPQWHPGVAKGTSIDPLARGPSTEPLLGQGHVARLSGTGVKPVSCRCFGRTSARHPRREASRWHPGVAKRTSIDPLARGSSTEALLGQGRVSKHLPTNLKPVSRQRSCRSSARRPLPQAPQWHPRVARGASIDPLARGPSTEPLLGQGHVARLSGTGVKPVSCRCFGRTSARHPRREASRWHPGVAKRVF